MNDKKPNILFRMLRTVPDGFVKIANFTRHILLLIVFLVAMFWYISVTHTVSISKNSALIIAPQGFVVNQYSGKPSDKYLSGVQGNKPPETQLRDIVKAIKSAATDSKISVLVLNPDNIWGIGLADLKEIEYAINNFKETSNKPVIAIAENLTQNQYYFANLADEIILDPQGFMLFSGFESYRNYFKDGLDKLGIDVHLFKVGEYKSAAEPFVRNDMSQEAKESTLYFMNDLWEIFLANLSEKRKIPFDEFSDIIEQQTELLKEAQGNFAKMYKKAGLVDHVKSSHFRGKYIASFSAEENNELGFRYVFDKDYLETLDSDSKDKANNIGIVVAEGTILNGSQDPGAIGGTTTSALLRQARQDDSIKAVVLRVNSPGGSVFASEQIRREVEALKVAGKPVVVSMGNVAASGGYWISMNADTIFAEDATITGSIGIYGMFLTYPKTLQKIGVNTDGVGTSSWSGAFRLDKGLSEDLKELIQANINHGYHQFINMVALSRNLDVDLVDQVARGRVWTAKQAKEFGLVDKLGGQQHAVEEAALLAKLGSDYGTIWVEEELSVFEKLALKTFENVSAKFEFNLISPQNQMIYDLIKPLEGALKLVLNTNDGPLSQIAHCFCEIK